VITRSTRCNAKLLFCVQIVVKFFQICT
jgi:hypothetical protein